jgi:spore germination protein KC
MVMILINQYKAGTLELPCPENKDSQKKKESFEVIKLDTKLIPKIKGNEVAVLVSTNIKGSISELRCSTLKTAEEGKQLEERLGNHIKKEMLSTIESFQNRKIDAFGIGNKIYRQNPKLWKQWKPDWDKRFAEAQFHVQVKVNIINTVMKTGTPFGKKEK